MTKIDVDVVVIGGGISGLAAAERLLATNHTVQLFEARSRLGGRIQSLPIAGGVAEMGATWFWDNEPRVRSLVDSFGIAVHDQWETGDAVVQTHARIARYGRPWSTNSRRFTNGASQLIDGLANRLPDGTVHLDNPVLGVKPVDGHIEIQLEQRLITARHVVVALPPSLAIANNLIDSADLEPKLFDAASNVAVWMGSIVKAVAIYDEPFWRADGLSGAASSQVGPTHEIHDISGPRPGPGVLFGFGQTTPDKPDLDPQSFINQLVALFGGRAENPTDIIIRDWRQQPWTTPDNWPLSERYDLFGAPILQQPAWDGKLFWCSTETASVAPGHIEGALFAAERAAKAIAEQTM